jgi:4-amino-4-deoxy-L-arabinose transferase-like glycosyltransferase
MAAFFVPMSKTFKLKASAAASMPRFLMIALTLVYALSGLFNHDPWKNDDAEGFGVMWMLAHGHLQDWLFPHISGRDTLIGPPLAYWIGALSIYYLGPLIGEINAARLISGVCFLGTTIMIWYSTYLLARRSEVQPMAFAFGGEPSPKEYGKTIADGALLIFLACVGLAIRVHEASPLLLQLLGLSLLLYGSMRGFDKPLQGGCIAGIALGVIALSGNLWTSILLCLASLISFHIGKKSLVTSWTAALLACFIVFLSIWPLMWLYAGASNADVSQAMHVWWGSSLFSSSVQFKTLEFLAVNFWGYTWPVWPLCFWSIYIWGKNGRQGLSARHLTIPGCTLLTLIILFLFNTDLSEKYLMLLIPPMAILASFGLPFLRRGLISFIDWLSLLSFTIVAGFIWIIWLAKLTGFPQATANNVSRYLPGFVAQFHWLDLIIALIITTLWIFIVRWRVSRSPKVIWRCLIISASGTTLMWVLLMTLWLPTINYAKTYQPVAMRFAKALPANAKCIDSSFLGNAQLASFVYFTRLPLEDNPHCDFMLTHSSSEARAAAIMHQKRLTLLWEDRRDSDKDERLRLYQVSP